MWLNISNMEERMFLVIVKGEINESEMSLKRAISEAIECEAKYDESPLYGCDAYEVSTYSDGSIRIGT